MTDANGDGIPDAVTAGALVAYSTTAFDDQARQYQTNVFSVNPITGAIGNAITTNMFYDSRGNDVATYTTGKGASKSVIDGAGRKIETFNTDGGAVELRRDELRQRHERQ